MNEKVVLAGGDRHRAPDENQGVVNYTQQQNVVLVYCNEYLIKNKIIPTKSVCIINLKSFQLYFKQNIADTCEI